MFKLLTKNIKKNSIRFMSLMMVLCLSVGAYTTTFAQTNNKNIGSSISSSVNSNLTKAQISQVTDKINTNIQNYFDSSLVYQLPEEIDENQEISVIVTIDERNLLEVYTNGNEYHSFDDFMQTSQANNVCNKIKTQSDKIINILDNAKVNYKVGERYSAILSGFEINVKSKDLATVGNLLKDTCATLIVGDEYLPASTEVVTNEVDVYETGIFDSSTSNYKGDGVVVAVLDTGLDYTHTSFAESHFFPESYALTLDDVNNKISNTRALAYTGNLTANDVYVSKKVPYAYDYADKDPDVFPINSEHGTHVAGVIAGQDDVITGVAPNAQLVIMKVFSDFATGAKTSWLLAALEDCVKLGVDVINMSLGTSCGFAREVDKQNINEIYDSIKQAGISLITAASNDYNSTHGSEKNGSNPLTRNPDSGTVGSPSTFDASLSVASVDGVKTPYLMYQDNIMYFTEANTSAAKRKDFVNDILQTVATRKGLNAIPEEYDFDYVTIPGIGRRSDYEEENEFYADKIVLVKRGVTTFEEKIRIALKEKGALGVIIYNNVSGTISMAVGADIGACCSLSQDDGELLAGARTGKINVKKSQVAGPFMSDFSSWGPTSDLQIKPEITGHGGEILSAVPGQEYDRLSGTSMACPNVAGATALVRQYVKSGVFGELTTNQVTALVNQLMMSTADIINNKNGLPYAVRKQGAGLVNIKKATSTLNYITTYNRYTGDAMDKSKLELGDDANKTGVYEMRFTINNVSEKNSVFDINSLLITEGVSTTYTSHGDQTASMDGYLLKGSKTTVTSIEGNGTNNGNVVTVNAKSNVTVNLKVVLSSDDMAYMDKYFENGIYVEGFITLKTQNGDALDLNVPMLAFYGDWTQAPIFDEEYYDTNVDEINNGINPEDKLMPDAYATRVIGGLYTDYISTLGSYYFVQDPSLTQIPASKEHISISNQESNGKGNVSVCSIRDINAGFLRNAKKVIVSIVEDSTGREIFTKTVNNQRKSYGIGNIYPSNIEVEFSALEHNLKNNTQYTVTVSAYIDYNYDQTTGEYKQNNVRNTFTFPLYIDFEAPVVTGVEYRTEYDKTTKKTSLFADLSIYDNHYAMGVQVGQIVPADPASGYLFSLNSFGKYVTPVYSSFNSTSKVTVELTDYINQLKQSVGIDYDDEGNHSVLKNNSFIATCYDYAMNSATYEIKLPDEILYMNFKQDQISLSPNQTMDLSSIMNVYPSESWIEILAFESSDTSIVDIVNQTVVAKASGTATITAIGYNVKGEKIETQVLVTVLSEGDEGYEDGYSAPSVNKFTITGYQTNKAFYEVSSSDREIGVDEGEYEFGKSKKLSMFPSERVTLQYKLDSYDTNNTTVKFSIDDDEIAKVDENGMITALAKGSTAVYATVYLNGKETVYSENVDISVKDPFITNSIYLNSYRGLGGKVEIPTNRGITTINTYAFSNYEYVDKDLDNGDVIDEEDPYYIKQQFIGEDTIEEVVIPEGVESIESYAFANLTKLKKVVMPSTLTRIGTYAFYNCTALEEINLDNVKFINKCAFENCYNLDSLHFEKVVAIGDYAFSNCKTISEIKLPKYTQSIGIKAFSNNEGLANVTFDASKVKVGQYAFENCKVLTSINVNSAVISAYSFNGCEKLKDVTLGKDVSVIGEYAFAGTNVSAFKVNPQNSYLKTENNGAWILKDGELILVAPKYNSYKVVTDATSIGSGAFAGNTTVFEVVANNVTKVGNYSFADCTSLNKIQMDKLEEVGNYAFFNCQSLENLNCLNSVKQIGLYAFAGCFSLENVTIQPNTKVGDYAFYYCKGLKSVTIGNDAVLGIASFYAPIQINTVEAFKNAINLEKVSIEDVIKTFYDIIDYQVIDENGEVVKTLKYYSYNYRKGATSTLNSLVIGDRVAIGDYAFYGNANLEEITLGNDARIGSYSFFNNANLSKIDLSNVNQIGNYAFSGSRAQEFSIVGTSIGYAYDWKSIDGEMVATMYSYSSFAPKLTEIIINDVSNVKEGAFANNRLLSKVTINGGTNVADYIFANCEKLTQLECPNEIEKIGSYSFYNTAFSEIDLSVVKEIGSYAFVNGKLGCVALADNVKIGESAFMLCELLTDVINLENASYIGAEAFSGTGISQVNLKNAYYVGDFAFADSNVEQVIFGDKITQFGENPFYACPIKTFAKYEDVEFEGNVVDSKLNDTYDVNEYVKVIDGVLYQVVNNGLELVCYPALLENESYTVKEGVVRISATAFAYSSLKNVTLPLTLKAVGDKAFYGCEYLKVVVFKSYYAPILEEEYDESYATIENVAYTGITYDVNKNKLEGLAIVPYYMWNATSSYNNYFYGANFVDYVGHINDTIVMVYPANGQNYNTFILEKYFGTKVLGSNAPTTDTLAVIELIDKIASKITLEDEQSIVLARKAYDSIPALEQQALVTNYSKLQNAESTLNYLKLRDSEDDQPIDPTDSSDEVTQFMGGYWWILIVVAVVIGLGITAYFVFFKKKKNDIE